MAQLPPLPWFRSFEAAARTLSFTAAAAEIGLTQSAVSQQIKALEQRLGVALFLRKPRGLALTDAGRRLLPEVEASLAGLARATALVAPPGKARQLTVAASVSMLDWVIAPRLSEFRAAHQDVSVRLRSTIWPDDFRSARADVEIRFGSARQVGAEAVALHPSDLIVVAAQGWTGSVADAALIEAVGTSDGWGAWGRAAGIRGLRASVQVDNYGLALRLARHGTGAALVSAAVAGPAVRSGLVVRAHSVSIPATEGYHLSVRSEAVAHAFADWLLALLKDPLG